jgi:hypothetical protein
MLSAIKTNAGGNSPRLLLQEFCHWPLELSEVLPETDSISRSATGGRGVLK